MHRWNAKEEPFREPADDADVQHLPPWHMLQFYKAKRAISALSSMGSPATSSPFQETIKQESLVDKVQALQLDIRAEKQSFEALSIQSSKPATETPSGCGGRASLEMPDAPTRTLDAPGGSGLDVFELAREAAAEVRAWMER